MGSDIIFWALFLGVIVSLLGVVFSLEEWIINGWF